MSGLELFHPCGRRQRPALTRLGRIFLGGGHPCALKLAQWLRQRSHPWPCCAACGGGGGETPDPGTSQEAGQAGGEITIAGCTPENPLIPGNTSEACGGDIIDAMTAKLVEYNTENAAPENDIAESIETDDNKNFTVKLKPGYKFHDGTDVKAKNFVDAWNYTAYGPERPGRQLLLSARSRATPTPSARTTSCKQKPKAEKMTGLKVVDDTTFTIKTSEPVSNLPVRLGYSAFAPLPDSFFADPKAFEKKPIGAGPFKMDRSATPSSCSPSSPTTAATPSRTWTS